MTLQSRGKRFSIARRYATSLACVLGAFVATNAGAGNILVNNPALDTTTSQTQSEAALLVFGSTIIAAFNDSGSNVGGANKFTGFARSTDGGLSFTDMGTLPTNVRGDSGDPHLARDNLTGTIYLSTLAFTTPGLQLFRSTDNGLTFGPPVNATSTLPANNSPDIHSIVVDNFSGAGQGNVYITVRDFGPGNGVYLVRSTDGGMTFGPAVLIASGAAGNVQGPEVTVAPDHSVTVSYFRTVGGANSLAERRSTDGGLTFGATTSIGGLNTTSINGDLALTGQPAGFASQSAFRSNQFPEVVVNPVTGAYYIIYADNPVGADKADVFLRISNDAGATWGSAIRINDDATLNDQWQPTLAVTPDGSHLGVFWYDRRNDAADNLIEYYGDICDVVGLGVSCGANFRISDVAFLPVFGQDPVVNSTYMGDYDIAQADNNFFYVAWGDNRNASAVDPARNQADVRFDRIAVRGSAVPVPGTLVLLFAAVLGMAVQRRR